jgi:hypothetical protein
MGDIGLCSWLSPSHLPKYPPLHDAHGQGQVRPDLSFVRPGNPQFQFRGRRGPRALIWPGNGEGIPDFRCGRNREPGNFPIPHSARSGNRGPRGGGRGISCPWSAVTLRLHRDRDGSLLKPRRPPTSESGLGSQLAKLLPNPDAAEAALGAVSECQAVGGSVGYFYKGHARANGHL